MYNVCTMIQSVSKTYQAHTSTDGSLIVTRGSLGFPATRIPRDGNSCHGTMVWMEKNQGRFQGGQGLRRTSEISAPSPPKKIKVQDKAATCLNFLLKL